MTHARFNGGLSYDKQNNPELREWNQRPTGRQADRQTDRQKDRQTDRQTDRQKYKQTDRDIDR